ncbi:MAG: aspartate/glutamate racemase family protein, partial [Clostridia bacterium]|nr:aspartate/glutamate racemase family protein [Clostridia bacterium]
PYGSKDEKQIIQYGVENANFLISKNVKMIVIACGTATSYALKTLQNKFDIPIIGIIQPTISYIKKLNLNQIRCYCN